MNNRRPLLAAAFILPSFIPLFAFVLVPMLSSVVVSFMSWDLLTAPEWVGWQNFIDLWRDQEVRAAFLHTFEFILGYLPITYVFGLLAALGLNRKMRGQAILRTFYFLPVVTSWVIVAIMWRWLLNPAFGAVNAALGFLHLPQPGWWLDTAWSLPSVILASAWKDIGYAMLILLAGLQVIPQEYYESASLDGASAWQKLRYITLPLLTPQSLLFVMISLINNMQVFEQVYVMTGGGPEGSSTTIVSEIYTYSFEYGMMGYASAISLALFAVTMLLTAVQYRLQRRWVTYEA